LLSFVRISDTRQSILFPRSSGNQIYSESPYFDQTNPTNTHLLRAQYPSHPFNLSSYSPARASISNPKDYTVDWIYAISTEYITSQTFLDENHDEPEYVSPNDNNDYTLGKFGRHNVVIAVLPDGEYGTTSAAMVARDMLYSFANIRIGLIVGIGGGAPSPMQDIRLGDIVVSAPRDGKGGVFQYNFDKTIQDQRFQPTGFLNQPPAILQATMNGLKAQYELKGHQLEKAINHAIQENPKLCKKYNRPDPSKNRLYQSETIHPTNDATSCEIVCSNDPSNLVLRSERSEDEDNLELHYGLIASANQLMKDATVRDRLAAEMDVLCFEMEAAGLMSHFPCLVIRGICDYSDSYKNKEWQGYAAMAAAAYAKDLLCRIPPNKVEAEKKIGETLSDS
jgi:nucleoside phosphorylase